MGASQNPSPPGVGDPVTTACGGTILYEKGMPNALYRGRRIYFCLNSCLKIFQDDPKTSCLEAEKGAEN